MTDELTPDEAGFRSWATARMAPLRRRAYLLCGDWHLADDLVQDTLVTVFARWPRLVQRGAPDAYAGKVMVSRFLDDRRRPWRREQPAQQVPDRADGTAARDLLDVEERDDVLAAALAGLPADQRAVLVLRYADDLALDEVARLLDLPLGTVKSRAARGTTALRAELARRGHHLAVVGATPHPAGSDTLTSPSAHPVTELPS